ncbi:TPA: hypothetical protein ACQUH4_001758 [Neisseria cinerea]
MLCRLKICGGKQIQDKTVKLKKYMPEKSVYFLFQKFSDGITQYFLVNKTGYFLSIAFRRLVPPPKKGRIGLGLGVVSTIASGVGTLIGGAAKAIGGMISTFAS